MTLPLYSESYWEELKSIISSIKIPEDSHVREILIKYWKDNALMEHASIGAFSKLSLELLSLGCPPYLLEQCALANIDEIYHARICFTVASHYAGYHIGPDEWRGLEKHFSIKTSFEKLGIESFIDGAIAEGLASKIIKISSNLSKDPSITMLYQRIATDEARHSDFGFSLLEWCMTKEKLLDEKKLGSVLQQQKNMLLKTERYMDMGLTEYGLIDKESYIRCRKELLVEIEYKLNFLFL